MSCCEKCWSDACFKSRSTGKSKTECYHEFLEERKDNPCTLEEQAGEYWVNGKDIRTGAKDA